MKLSGKEFVKSFNVRICPEENDDDDDDDDNAAIGNGMQWCLQLWCDLWIVECEQ